MADWGIDLVTQITSYRDKDQDKNNTRRRDVTCYVSKAGGMKHAVRNTSQTAHTDGIGA
jgi:hypothetical protein